MNSNVDLTKINLNGTLSSIFPVKLVFGGSMCALLRRKKKMENIERTADYQYFNFLRLIH